MNLPTKSKTMTQPVGPTPPERAHIASVPHSALPGTPRRAGHPFSYSCRPIGHKDDLYCVITLGPGQRWYPVTPPVVWLRSVLTSDLDHSTMLFVEFPDLATRNEYLNC